MSKAIENLLGQLFSKIDGNYGKDFLQTWDKNDNAIHATIATAQILKQFYQNNLSAKAFDSGLAISIFKDQSTRTRYSFNSATNFLGLLPVELDLGKSQVTHGETVYETINMISFLTRAIGIRDDIYLGIGAEYIQQVAKAVDDGFREKVLHYRPSVINLQSDLDHPTQSMSDLVHLVEHFGDVEELKGKKMVMSWAYSPSYGKPLSVAQGIIGLMSRFGMDLTLAYPKKYHLIPEIEELARDNSNASGGNFNITHSMDEAFKDADVVYPKSWASFDIMEERTKMLREGNTKAYENLEKEALAENEQHVAWECNRERMKLTKNGNALYMHCLPADISGVSCQRGEVTANVFDKYRKDMYLEARNKPFVIAAMILLSQLANPLTLLEQTIKQKKLLQY